MKTTVINLLAGPGVGKSTFAADLFSALKKQGRSVELVREFVKDWAWEGKAPGMFDQVYILGNQAHAESMLYGKVEYIITDSPLLLSPFYERYNYKIDTVSNAVNKFLLLAAQNGVVHRNFWLKRTTEYKSEGRFQKKDAILELDLLLSSYIGLENCVCIDPMNPDAVKAVLENCEPKLHPFDIV